MVVHLDKLIRHLKAQISTAEQLKSEFVYITKREAEGCLELAEAQDVIQEMLVDAVRCRECRYANRVKGVYMCEKHAKAHEPEYYCADGKRRGKYG